jgi:hypothetical protein
MSDAISHTVPEGVRTVLSYPPFFAYPYKHRALREELESWKGTRFWPACGSRAKKGVGADCVSFAERVLVNLGAIQPIKWPPYVIAGGGLKMFDTLVDAIATVPNIQRVWISGELPLLLPGDIFLRSVGDDYHHLAIYAGDKTLWHCRPKRGVCTANVDDTHARKDLKAIYRVYEQ